MFQFHAIVSVLRGYMSSMREGMCSPVSEGGRCRDGSVQKDRAYKHYTIPIHLFVHHILLYYALRLLVKKRCSNGVIDHIHYVGYED